MNKLYGIIFAILSSTAFGFMPIFAKEACIHGSNTLTILTVRYVFASAMLFVYFIIKKVNLRVNKRQLIIMLLIGILGYISTGLGLFMSYNYISVGLATTMHFVYPAIVILMNYFIYKVGFTKNKIASLFLSLVGVYILVGLDNKNIDIKGSILAITSGFTYACCIMGMNDSEIKKLDNTVLVFYLCLFAGILLLLFTYFTGQWSLSFNTYSIISYIGISFISTIISIVLFMKSLKIIGPSSASILSTFEPIVSIIMGILIFKESLTLPILIGTILILISVVILAKEKN